MANEIDLENEDLTAGQARAVLGLVAGCAWLSGAAVLRVLAYRVAEAEALAKRAVKAAAKLGVEPVRLAPLGVSGRHVWLAVYGAAPRVDGHTFVARVEHTAAGNVVTSPAVGRALALDLTAWRDAPPACVHCGTDRRRKDTFILQAPDGALVQVGRNCLADFIRSTNVAAGLSLWKLLGEIEAGHGEECDSFGCAREDWSALEFVAHACAAIRVEGFHKSCDSGPSTKSTVLFSLFPRPTERQSSEQWESLQPTPQDSARAATVLAWASSQTNAGDYLYNLRVASRCFTVGRRGGLLASAPAAYARVIEGIVAKRIEAAKRAHTSHVGEVGKRGELGDLMVARVRHLEGDWGTRTIVALTDTAGNAVTWFASGALEFTPGDVLVSSRATIKKHETYREAPQTVVSRLAWKELIKSAVTP